MKNTLSRMVVLVVVAAITSAAALAQTIRKEVTFIKAVTVNGSLVKPGTYEVRFDDETDQLRIVKGGKVIASAEAQLEKADEPGYGRYVTRSATNDPGKPPVLVSISLKSGTRANIVNSGE